MQHSFESLDRPGGFARVGLLRPLRSRDFRLLWAGQSISLVGDGIFLIAMAWTAFQLWNSPASLSIVGIAMTVPIIGCLLLGGAVSDRFDRRKVMIAADAVRTLVVGLIAALDLTGALDFATFAVLVALYGAATAFFTLTAILRDARFCARCLLKRKLFQKFRCVNLSFLLIWKSTAVAFPQCAF